MPSPLDPSDVSFYSMYLKALGGALPSSPKDYYGNPEFFHGIAGHQKYRCLLFGKTGTSQSHKSTSLHKAHVDALFKEQIYCIQRFFTVLSLMRQVQKVGAPVNITQGLFSYMFLVPKGTRKKRLAEIKRLLDKYVKCQPMVLLELIVWRAACRANHSEETTKHISSCMDWYLHGWKQIKAKRRYDPMIEVVLKNVAPFMDA